MKDWTVALIGALTSGAVSAVLTPLSMRIAPRVGAMDVPCDARRLHTRPVPRAGGLALVGGLLVGVLAVSALAPLPLGATAALLVGGALICLVGILDDVIGLSPSVKLIGQLAACTLCVALGATFGRVWGKAMAVLWMALLINAHNMIDGLDGLCAGIGAIEGGVLCGVLWIHGQMSAAAMSALLLGGCLGFRPYNRHPARVFLGDTGSQLLGYWLGALSLYAVRTGQGALYPLILPLAFAVPLSDLVFAVVRRVGRGQSPFAADRGHWHHRLLDRLASQRAVCTVMLLLCGTLGGVGVLLCREAWYPFAVYAVLSALGLVIGLGALRGQGAVRK